MHSRGRMVGRLLEKSLAFVSIRQSVCAHAYPRGRAEGERSPLMSSDHSFGLPHLRGRVGENESNFSGVAFQHKLRISVSNFINVN